MPHHLIRKLEHFTRLSDDDKAVLLGLTRKVRLFEAGTDIIQEGASPEHVNLFLDGWASRYKQLEDGRRQIVSFFVPGDLCDLHIFILREMDHAIAAITPVRLAQIPREVLLDLMDRHPRITRALWWETLVNAAIQREWTVNLGRRTALERLAHLFCELFIRLRATGLTDGNTCAFPITQLDLADATGLTSVHVNRTLKEMRASGLIILKGRQLTVPDLAALRKAGLFNPNYLHLERDGAHLSANA